MTKLCARGKAAAKRKFSVYPSAYANAYASKICAGKIKDPSGVKRKDFKGPKPARTGILIETNQDLKKERKEKEDKKYIRKRKFPKSDGKSFFDVIIKGAEILNKPPAKKIGGETKINKVITGLKKASKLHAAQAKSLQSVIKAKSGISVEELKSEAQKVIENFPKEKKYNYKKPKKKPYSIAEPSESMKVDTTTSAYGDAGKGRKVPEFTRGGGAAIRGMGFKGVF